jgi:endonuclease-3
MSHLLLGQQPSSLRSIREQLQNRYGRIRDEHRLDPVSQFVRCFIGSRTHDPTSWSAFLGLMIHFKDWNAIADAPVTEIETEIKDVAHPEKKAPDLKRALQKIRVRAGAINLDFLEDLAEEPALVWLEQIHGVGPKIAAATLNFSTLRKRCFVIDSHILRVLQRFGFAGPKAGFKDAYRAVMAAADGFDADELYELHWHLKRLGQELCTPEEAFCGDCPLSVSCMKRIEGPAWFPRPAA